MPAEKMHVYVDQNRFVGKYFWFLLSNLFPPSSLTLCALSLSPRIQTLLGCGECRPSGSPEINIQLRCEWGLPNNDWPTDIERAERAGGRKGETRADGGKRKWQEVECEILRGQCLVWCTKCEAEYDNAHRGRNKFEFLCVSSLLFIWPDFLILAKLAKKLFMPDESKTKCTRRH